MSNYSKKDLDFFANKTLENYDSKNPSIIFKEKIKITNEDALIIQSNVAELRKKRGARAPLGLKAFERGMEDQQILSV